jgi:hypothetical protein
MSRLVDIFPQKFQKSFVREPTAPVFISMSTNSVLKNADELIARAQAIATVQNYRDAPDNSSLEWQFLGASL